MATSSVQNESVPAKPLDLWGTGMALETIEVSADELAALIFTVASANGQDPEISSALRAIGKLAACLGVELIELREAVYAASKAERGANIADFPAR